jgi:multidrug efflux pump subunit AcrA (membrane-fusion protein)
MNKSLLSALLLLALVGTFAWSAQPDRFAQNSRFAQADANTRRQAQARNAFDEPAPAAAGPVTSEPRLSNSFVLLKDEAKVPAQEPGVLVELAVVEGSQVKSGDVVGQIEDSQPRMQRKAAQAELKAAEEKAKSNVDERYAKKASEVAYKEWEKAREANQKTPGSISQVEVARLYLTYERGLLEIERAQTERKMSGHAADAKSVEVEAATEAMKRRQITSPIDGMIVKVYLHKGEWVKPGDPVMHVVNLDQLKVQGTANIAELSPELLMDKKIVVEAELTEGRKEQFSGRITFVNPIIQGRDTYIVKAEVQNRKERGRWLLQPGMPVELTILLNERG